jgi:hypothetical protein
MEPPALTGPYPQEKSTVFHAGEALPEGPVHSIVSGQAGVAVGTDSGVYVLNGTSWAPLEGYADAPATLVREVGSALGAVQGGALVARIGSETQAMPIPESEINAVVPMPGNFIYVATSQGLFLRPDPDDSEVITPSALNDLLGGAGVNALAYHAPSGQVAAATGAGLFVSAGDEAWERVEARDEAGLPWGLAPMAATAYDNQGRLWLASKAGVARMDTAGAWTFWTGEDGLPWNEFTCMAVSPDGDVWFGTTIGAIRWRDGQGFVYRQGPRYMPGDHVNDLAFQGAEGVWFATDKGVGLLAYPVITLAEKAGYYEEQAESHIKRTPFGYTSEVSLAEPGKLDSEIHKSDSDNDGLWTAMWGASQCYAYAVTKDPGHKERATEAFEALRFLQKVTQGSEHSPPHGYVARTILPTDGPDPNEGRVDRDISHRQTDDSLWKVYEPRWPVSADGAWYFKTDTSSDELDGHYYFYPLYYDLVAESEEDKARVVEVVRDLTDHLMAHDWDLVDHDGTPTRWSIYGPKDLNHNKMWFSERGLKSLSILSYLAVTYHMTGDEKYAEAIRQLDEEHGYVQNAMVTKIQFGVGSGNQSDDEMAIMCYYNFMKYAPDAAMRDRMGYSFYSYWTIVEPERNPFFHFAYAAFGQDQTWTNPWGTFDISPWEGWLEDSVETLKGFPLDRLDWPLRNSHRLDIVKLRRQQMVEPYEPMHQGRGHLVNGKVLPVENRHFNHWNTDPWRLDYGGSGRTLASGTVYLLPYWMGRYHGFIEDAL